MAKQVLFIQGGGAGAHAEDARLAESLEKSLGPEYAVRFPEMPNEDEPDYRAWARVIERELASLGEGVVLVGHSIGASVSIQWLTEPSPSSLSSSLSGVFLAATPFWHDHEIWRWDEVRLPDDAAAKLPPGVPIHFYHGREDETVPFSHLGRYAALFPRAATRALAGRNHQLNEDLSEVANDIRALSLRSQ